MTIKLKAMPLGKVPYKKVKSLKLCTFSPMGNTISSLRFRRKVDGKAVLAYNGSKVVGWLTLEKCSYTRKWDLNIFVKLEDRCKGIGKKLMRYAMKLYGRKGFSVCRHDDISDGFFNNFKWAGY